MAKHIRILICLAGALLLLSAGIGGHHVKAEEDIVLLKNDRILMNFDDHGQLIGLQNLRTGKEYLSGLACGYRTTVNVSTADLWATVRGEEVQLSSAKVPAVITSEKTSSSSRLNIEQVFTLETGIIRITRQITLKNGSDFAYFDMRIENHCEKAVVTQVQAMALKGLVDSEAGFSILWPNLEGEIHANALAAKGGPGKLKASYPAPMSMQYTVLFNEQESLYFGVHDAQRLYKTFEFSGKNSELSCELWPFVSPNEEKAMAPVVIGVTDGDWHSAADIYRNYLIENGFAKSFPPMVREFVGFKANNMTSYPDRPLLRYTDGTAALNDIFTTSKNNFEAFGTKLSVYMGWHERGFDSRYPDYEFIEAIGGEEKFAQAMGELNEAGYDAAMYINLHIADTQSKWYSQLNEHGVPNGEAAAIRTKYNSVLHESYGTGLDYVAMCPMAAEWQQAIVGAVERLRRNGTDAMWFDQLMEMPANLCYNRNHGHSTPAAAYAEGYDSLLGQIDAIMSAYGSDYLYCCEGTSDAYIQYIDICGLMWARLLGHSKETAPEITRYTMPSKFLGLPSAGQSEGAQGQYGHAWVMAEGMLVRGSNAVYKRFAQLCRRYPDVYFDGRYLDTAPLTSLPEDIRAGAIVSEDGKRMAIQLWNMDDSRAEFTLALKSGAYGDRSIVSVVDAESGDPLTWTDDGVEVMINGRRVAAIMVTFE